MKIVDSQCRNSKSYFVTLSVSDYDIEALEDLAMCENTGKEEERLQKWLIKTFKEFQKLWNKYD